MARREIPEWERKRELSITINHQLHDLLMIHIEDIGVNRSKYIESLIREDMIKRGEDINRKF